MLWALCILIAERKIRKGERGTKRRGFRGGQSPLFDIYGAVCYLFLCALCSKLRRGLNHAAQPDSSSVFAVY